MTPIEKIAASFYCAEAMMRAHPDGDGAAMVRLLREWVEEHLRELGHEVPPSPAAVDPHVTK